MSDEVVELVKEARKYLALCEESRCDSVALQSGYHEPEPSEELILKLAAKLEACGSVMQLQLRIMNEQLQKLTNLRATLRAREK